MADIYKASVSGLGNQSPTSQTYTKDENFPTSFEEITDNLGNIFIKIPTMYRKVNSVVDNQITSFTMSTAKVDDTYEPYSVFVKPDGTIMPYVLIGKYQYHNETSATSVVEGSIVNLTIGNARTYARNLGIGYQLYDWQFQKLFQDLALVISQKVNFNSGTEIKSYLDLENLNGNCWIDGVTRNGATWFIAYDPTKYVDRVTSSTTGYVAAGYTSPTTNNNISKLGYDSENPFFNYPNTVVNNSNNDNYYCDMYFYSSGNCPASSNVGIASGYYGLWHCRTNDDWSKTLPARLCYRPLDETVVDEPEQPEEPEIPEDFNSINEFFTAVGDAIRTKKGTTDKIKKKNIPGEILSIESSGGADLNIHYGLTEPEDTSKLWVKVENEPSKVEISNKASGGNETLDYGINSLSNPLYLSSSAVVGKYIYIFGGFERINDSNIRTDNIIRYNTETNTLENLTETQNVKLPFPLYDSTTASVGNKIYIFGGYGVDYLNTIQVFDTETNTLENLTETQNVKLPKATYNMASAVVGNKIYLIGGSTSDGLAGTFYVFNTLYHTIEQLNTTITARRNHSCSVFGNNIYIFGGYKKGTANTEVRVNDILVFDTIKATLKSVSATLYEKTADCVSYTIGNKIYIFGGTGTKSNGNTYYLNTISVYEPETNSLTTLTKTLHTTTAYMVGGVVENKAYIIGGRNESYLSSINRFNVAFDVQNNTLALLNQLTNNKVSIIKSDNINVEIGVKMALLGDENNEGQSVPFAIHNGTEWVDG